MTAALFDVPASEPEPEPLTEKHTEASMLHRIRQRYTVTSQGTGSRYLFATHVRDGAGFDRRTADAVVLDTWQGGARMGHQHPMDGFEVKVSRSDWLRELKDPSKATAVARYCLRWWLVIPSADMVRPGELPDDWGLLVCHGLGLRATKHAPLRKPEDPPRGFWVAFSRAAVKTEKRRVLS